MEIKATEIILFPISKLSEYSLNANEHTQEQIDKIIELGEYYGFRDPLIVDKDLQPDGTHWVLAGNGRLQAARKAGWENLPIILQSFKSDAEKYGFMVSHNAASSTGWGGGLNRAKVNTDILDLGPDFNIEMLAIKDFTIEPVEKFEMEDELRNDMNKKFILEITFPNDMEMMDIHDDLVSRGYIVKVKDK